MENNRENFEQAKVDLAEYAQYLEDMITKNPLVIVKTFKEMFGYEIIFSEGGGYKFVGEPKK